MQFGIVIAPIVEFQRLAQSWQIVVSSTLDVEKNFFSLKFETLSLETLNFQTVIERLETLSLETLNFQTVIESTFPT